MTKLDKYLGVRLSSAELLNLMRAAKRRGCTVSDIVRAGAAKEAAEAEHQNVTRAALG